MPTIIVNWMVLFWIDVFDKYTHLYSLSLSLFLSEENKFSNGFNLVLNVWSWMNTDRIQSAGLFCMQFHIHHVYWSECSQCTNYLLFSFPNWFSVAFFFLSFSGCWLNFRSLLYIVFYMFHIFITVVSQVNIFICLCFCFFFVLVFLLLGIGNRQITRVIRVVHHLHIKKGRGYALSWTQFKFNCLVVMLRID